MKSKLKSLFKSSFLIEQTSATTVFLSRILFNLSSVSRVFEASQQTKTISQFLTISISELAFFVKSRAFSKLELETQKSSYSFFCLTLLIMMSQLNQAQPSRF